MTQAGPVKKKDRNQLLLFTYIFKIALEKLVGGGGEPENARLEKVKVAKPKSSQMTAFIFFWKQGTAIPGDLTCKPAPAIAQAKEMCAVLPSGRYKPVLLHAASPVTTQNPRVCSLCSADVAKALKRNTILPFGRPYKDVQESLYQKSPAQNGSFHQMANPLLL